MGWGESISKFVSDGYQKFQSIRKDWAVKEGEKETMLQGLVRKAGIPVDNIKAIYDQSGSWQGLMRKIVGSEPFQTGIHEFVAAGAAVASTAYTDGAGPALAALTVEGTSLVKKAFTDGASPAKPLEDGAWCYIDNGGRQLPRAAMRALQWGLGSEFQDMPDSEDVQFSVEHLVSIGFVVEASVDASNCQVFNMEHGEFAQYPKQSIRMMEDSRAAALDQNEDLHAIRVLVMAKEHVAQRLACDVPCDPGEEVIYKEVTYHVVTCDGTNVRIENDFGGLNVEMKDVTRGRVTHTNSWNYGETPGAVGSGLSAGFDQGIQAKLYKGQWVWVPARGDVVKLLPDCKKELAVVRIINGHIVDGYYAIDGLRMRVLENHITPVYHARQEWLNSHKDFIAFRAVAVTGEHSVRTYALGTDYLMVVAGLSHMNEVLTFGEVEEGHIQEGETQGELDVYGVAPLATIPEDRTIHDDDPTKTLDARMEVEDTVGRVMTKATELQTRGGQLLQTAKIDGPKSQMILLCAAVIIAAAIVIKS